jgi:hypothetical protein
MRTRTFCRWGLLSLGCLALLTGWAQTGRPQPPTVSAPPAPRDDTPRIPPPEIKLPTVAPTPTPAPPPTVEDLIKQLEQLRKEKAELERQEKELVNKLQQRMKDQADRLNKLGIVLPAPPQPEAKDAVDAMTPVLKTAGGHENGKP